MKIRITQYILWLNTAFMPFRASSWVLPASLKGARLVVGYGLDITFRFRVIGVWRRIVMGGGVRRVCFGWRLISGRWLENDRRQRSLQSKPLGRL